MQGSSKRKIIAIFSVVWMIFVLVGGLTMHLSADNAVKKHWADKEIQDFNRKGYIASAEHFEPDRKITRAEFITIVNKILNLKAKKDVPFKDVSKESWYYD